ncbi:MAG: HEAT repeat domain-containing protein [Candidatus Thiodiazotropha sp.]
MALKKTTEPQRIADQEKRHETRDYDGLVKELTAESINERRWAARDLVAYPQAVPVLLQALRDEQELVVQKAMLDALEAIGGEPVVTGLIPLLRSEQAALRNGVIEALASMPEAVALHIIELLNDQDSDVRIFAIDILQLLAHPDTPKWLLSVLKDETHINVVAAAVDRLAEVGTPEMVEEILSLKQRFPDEPYLHFAVDTAVQRIRGD